MDKTLDFKERYLIFVKSHKKQIDMQVAIAFLVNVAILIAINF